MKTTFMGYKRADGSVGIRNHVAIISTVGCANVVVRDIGERLPEVATMMHVHGCGRAIENPMHTRCLTNFGNHPNVCGAVVVALGCEGINGSEIAEGIAKSGRPVEFVRIQDGGTIQATEKGVAAAEKMLLEAKKQKREESPVSALMLGTECGGSDALSGVTANPAIGNLSDWVLKQGGASVLSEMLELTGAGRMLCERAVNETVAKDIADEIRRIDDGVVALMGPRAGHFIAPGNMAGGMTTIHEKSLGCVRKGGAAPIQEVVGYGEKPTKKGLVIMKGTALDAANVAGLASMGCQLICFSTGRGNPLGFPIIPVVKIASNNEVYERMTENIDVNAGKLLKGAFSFDDLLEEMGDLLIRVCNGEQTKAEVLRTSPMIDMWTYTPQF